MSNKHTQGQWIFGKFNNFEYFDIDCNGNRIASVYCGIDTPQDFQNEAEANAKLIAAAPELLEALKVLLKEARQNSFIATGSISDTAAEMAAQEAINKATY